MEQYAQQAINELKRSGDWQAHEERINYSCEYSAEDPPSRVLLLIILRGETLETIPIRLELKPRKHGSAYVEDIKRQVVEYFGRPAATNEIRLPNGNRD